MRVKTGRISLVYEIPCKVSFYSFYDFPEFLELFSVLFPVLPARWVMSQIGANFKATTTNFILRKFGWACGMFLSVGKWIASIFLH